MMNIHKKKFQVSSFKFQGSGGFTLVEMIVALGLFTVVMGISVGALLSVTDTNRKVQSMRIAMDNLNLAVEEISRNVRMGTFYYCNPALPISVLSSGNDCAVGADSLVFISSKGELVAYRLSGSGIEKSWDGGTSFTALTAPEIVIDNLTFYVLGTGAGSQQPRVIISVGGTAGSKENLKSEFKLQSTITQRIPK